MAPDKAPRVRVQSLSIVYSSTPEAWFLELAIPNKSGLDRLHLSWTDTVATGAYRLVVEYGGQRNMESVTVLLPR